MKRMTLLVVATLLVGFGLSLLASREEPTRDRPAQGEPLPRERRAAPTVIPPRTRESEHAIPAGLQPAPLAKRSEANAQTESVRTLDAMAVEAWKHGDIPHALELFEEAVKADPEDAPVRSDYGRLLTLMTAYDKALAHFERAAELEPDDPAVWLDLKTLYEREIKLERAFEAHERAENLAGGRRIVKDESGFWMLEGDRRVP